LTPDKAGFMLFILSIHFHAALSHFLQVIIDDFDAIRDILPLVLARGGEGACGVLARSP
jgi:hypothetical protein